MPVSKENSRLSLLGLPFDASLTPASILDRIGDKSRAHLISFINPAAWALAQRDPNYVRHLEQMDNIAPDGIGVCIACRTLIGKPSSRISFDMSSLADFFFQKLAATGQTLVLAGGKSPVAEKVGKQLQDKYPKIRILGCFTGYGDWREKIEEILAINPDTVLIGMGAPTQEAFMIALHKAGYNGLAISCGGFFDQFLEAQAYYPTWINALHLRFAYRLFKEPKRLWRRYLLDYPYFIWLYLRALSAKLALGHRIEN